MQERTGLVTFQGQPLTLIGQEIRVGDPAPDFQVVNLDLQPVSLQTFSGKIKVISSVPSLDTSVCSTETQKFNQLAGQLGDDTVILTISMDLPFAQKRWCGAHGVDRVVVLSDYKDRSFGYNYGVYIKELGLLTRAIFVIDPRDVVRYIQIVPEVTEEPDYDAVLQAVRSIRA